MKLVVSALFFLSLAEADLFNYGNTDTTVDGEKSYGMPNWNRVECSNEDTCRGWPDKFPFLVGWDAGRNTCQWCPEGGPENCGFHRQSPIDLKRDRGVIGGSNEKSCPDWHWMAYKDDTCAWKDMVDEFSIERHGLRLSVPIESNGEISCVENRNGQDVRRFPRLDYSKGFPDWWWLQSTDISVPSHHTQEGKRYDAEVTLKHFYEIEHDKNQLGYVTLFMEAYDDAESWPFLDKLICAWREKEEKVRRECGLPPSAPYGRCRIFSERGQQPTDAWRFEAGELQSFGEGEPAPVPSVAPTKSPTASITTLSPVIPTTSRPTEWVLPPIFAPPSVTVTTDTPTITEQIVSAPPPIDCDAFDMNYDRLCYSNDPCCETQRSTSEYCWDAYENIFPGNAIYSACHHCCGGERKSVGPPSPINPKIPKTLQCSSLSNEPNRMCNLESCCDGSDSSYCRDVQKQFGDKMTEICWYCCSEPKEYDSNRRTLRGTSLGMEVGEDIKGVQSFPSGTKFMEVDGRRLVLRKENFERDEESEEDYFNRIYSNYKHRSLQATVHQEDYADIEYWPYEWMLKVNTEYYFRYEGTQVVAPCAETVHWRAMKDPIKIHPRQLAELTRLLKERIAPTGDPNSCQSDTAGVSGSDGSLKLNRDLQYYHNVHRKVFCECKDWPSKFESDKQWCRNWQDDTNYERFYQRPYSFDSNGEW
jgi:hypothetical protein